MQLLDEYLVDADILFNDVLQQAGALLNTIRDDWATDIAQLTALLLSWCVPCWETHADTLLDHEQVCDCLLKNPDFPKIAAGCNLLNEMVKMAHSFHREAGPFLKAAAVTAGKSAVTHSS